MWDQMVWIGSAASASSSASTARCEVKIMLLYVERSFLGVEKRDAN